MDRRKIVGYIDTDKREHVNTVGEVNCRLKILWKRETKLENAFVFHFYLFQIDSLTFSTSFQQYNKLCCVGFFYYFKADGFINQVENLGFT